MWKFILLAAAAAAFAAPPDGWQHRIYRDDLDGKETPYALLRASGPREAWLKVAKTESGLVVNFLVENALCRRKAEGFYCPGRYRVDEAPAEVLSAYAGDNLAAGTMLISTPELLRELAHAKRLRIQVEFAKDGPVTFDFHWDKFPSF
jgi:hypothetical protein